MGLRILVVAVYSALIVSSFKSWNFMHRVQSKLSCVGTILTPLNQGEPGSERYDNDNSWKTVETPTIVPVKRELFSVRPELITFDAYNTLISRSQSIGRWYREALNAACNMAIRLPRPEFFTASFNKAYKNM